MFSLYSRGAQNMTCRLDLTLQLIGSSTWVRSHQLIVSGPWHSALGLSPARSHSRSPDYGHTCPSPGQCVQLLGRVIPNAAAAAQVQLSSHSLQWLLFLLSLLCHSGQQAAQGSHGDMCQEANAQPSSGVG